MEGRTSHGGLAIDGLVQGKSLCQLQQLLQRWSTKHGGKLEAGNDLLHGAYTVSSLGPMSVILPPPAAVSGTVPGAPVTQ